MGMGLPPPHIPMGDPRDSVPFSPLHKKKGGPRGDPGVKYRWSEYSVDHDLPFIQETKRMIENPASTIGFDAGASFKEKLKFGLEQLGWKYSRSDSFKANFPFRRRYALFDSTDKLNADDEYRLKVVMGRGMSLDYKLMKWISTTKPDLDIVGVLIDLISTKKGLAIIVVCVAVLIILSSILC